MPNDFSSIKSSAELKFKIMQLNNVREEQELDLKRGLKELYYSLHPMNIMKSTLSEFAHDKQVQFDATKIGLNIGTDFIINKLLGNNLNIKKYLSSIILQKASDYILTNHPEKIIWGVEKLTNLFKSFSKGSKRNTNKNSEGILKDE